MALTRSFKELVQKRIASAFAYGKALLHEGIDTMLAGDIAGRAILLDYIKATVGFEKLGEATVTAEEPHPDVRPARQPASPQPLRHYRLPAETSPASSSTSAGGQGNLKPAAVWHGAKTTR
jgi:hypothetical protein